MCTCQRVHFALICPRGMETATLNIPLVELWASQVDHYHTVSKESRQSARQVRRPVLYQTVGVPPHTHTHKHTATALPARPNLRPCELWTYTNHSFHSYCQEPMPPHHGVYLDAKIIQAFIISFQA